MHIVLYITFQKGTYMLELTTTLTTLHILYLIGVVVILAVMVLRRDTPVICILFLFLLGLTATGTLAGGIQTVFNARSTRQKNLWKSSLPLL